MSAKRIAHLIKTKAFTRHNLPGGIPKGSILETEVKRLLEEWEDNRKDLLVLKSAILYITLRQRSRQRKGLLPLFWEAEAAIKGCATYPSSLGPVEIRDGRGVILGYRFRIPDRLIQILNHSTASLQPTPQRARGGGGDPLIRGKFQVRHYAVWSDYSSHYREGKELARDKDEGREWLETNKELFDYCSQQLRFLCPEQYVKMTGSVVKDMQRAQGPAGKPLKPLAGAWHGVAINEGLQGDESKGHQDCMDDKRLFNCVVPFGNGFSGGDLVLWELKARIGLGIGDGFFFYGSIVAHQVLEITEGIRNSLDLFTHASNFDVLAKHKKLANQKQYPKKEKQIRAEARTEKARKVPENVEKRREIREGKQARQRALKLGSTSNVSEASSSKN